MSALVNPSSFLAEAIAEKQRRSLHAFVRGAWRYVEPTRPLADNWHVGAICDHLQEVTRGGIQRLLINIPPGHAKSLLVSVLWPAWVWTHSPAWRALVASYADDLVVRDSMRSRALMDSDWYRDSFVEGRGAGGEDLWEFRTDQNRKDEFMNTATGHRTAMTTHSKATGLKGDTVVVDDPLNVTDARSEAKRRDVLYWWDQVMPTRVSDLRTGSFVMVMQRIHEEDLSGHVLASGDWEHLCLPAEFEGERRARTYHVLDGARKVFFEDPRKEEGELLFPEMFPVEVLEKLKRPTGGGLGADGYAGQFQQRPGDAKGSMFKFGWWRFWRPDGSDTFTWGHASVVVDPARWPRPRKCDVAPAKVIPKLHRIVGSLDAAFKDLTTSDYVVFTVWGVWRAERYLLDVARGKMDFPTTCKKLVELAAKWDKCNTWLVEDKANGSAVISTLKTVVSGLIAVNPEGGKEARAAACTPACEAGQVFLPDGVPWVSDYVEEHGKFPRGKHDDQVDSTSQAIIYLGGNVDVSRALALVTM